MANTQMARITTLGSDVLINAGRPVRLHGIKAETATATTVLLKDNAAAPNTVASIASGAFSPLLTVNLAGAVFSSGLNVHVTGANILLFWEPI